MAYKSHHHDANPNDMYEVYFYNKTLNSINLGETINTNYYIDMAK